MIGGIASFAIALLTIITTLVTQRKLQNATTKKTDTESESVAVKTALELVNALREEMNRRDTEYNRKIGQMEQQIKDLEQRLQIAEQK